MPKGVDHDKDKRSVNAGQVGAKIFDAERR
jgi:hypothetical protein